MLIEDYARHYLSDIKVRGNQLDGKCPFHNDNTRSFTISISTGLFKCFNPECSAHNGGNFASFLGLLSVPDKEIKTIIKNLNKGDSGCSEEFVERAHKELLSNEHALQYLNEMCGLTHETITKFKLGWSRGRFQIPIFVKDTLVNIRKYNPTSEAKVIGIRGMNKPTFFPFDNLANNPIVIMGGEKDTILACQLGFNAVTSTGGEGFFPKEHTIWFKDKDIVIIYDSDEAGERGATKVYDLLKRVAATIKIIVLPLTKPLKDFTDFIVREHKTKENIDTIIEEHKYAIAKNGNYDIVPVKTTLSKIMNPDLYHKKLTFPVVIFGRDIDPFIAPKEVTIKCSGSSGSRFCKICPIGNEDIVYVVGVEEIISLINLTDRQLDLEILTMAGLNTKCQNVIIEKNDLTFMYRVKLETPISWAINSQQEVSTNASGVVIGNAVETNKVVECTGLLASDPKTQTAIIVITDISKVDNDIDSLTLGETWITLRKTFGVN